ncbi:hypothetical protein EDC28_102541 [Gallaecimonas pentaromativorans]|uniref:Uncharacterized protein n=1 Tax=Gallaecimonas pentaromativorans TaxID=584787 RepID=A0A3N1PQ79_9GAMM|nr:hypothetical protein EDC28_102541 [Gallaecimonas pentaromativorans]
MDDGISLKGLGSGFADLHQGLMLSSIASLSLRVRTF